MNEKKLTDLYVRGARLLQQALDPLPLAGRDRKRPFSGETSNRVDKLWPEMEQKPTLEGAKELYKTYQAIRVRGGLTWGLPYRLEEELKPIEEQIINLEKGGE